MKINKLVTEESFFDTGEAIVRIERPEYDFSLSTLVFETKTEEYAPKETVISYSRKTYSTPKQQIETILNESMSEGAVQESTEKKTPETPKP